MNKLLKNEDGAALIVTLTVVIILMVAAFQLQRMTTAAVNQSQILKNAYKAEQIAVSGIYFASLILTEDALKTSTDSLQEEWADEQWLSDTVNTLGYNPGALTLKITDELSKLQVNAFLKIYPGNEISPDQLRVWETFFRMVMEITGQEDSDPAPMVNSLKDWLDSLDDDAVSGISGAESEYYESLTPPYASANGPMNLVDEIFMVKGIAPEFFKVAAENADKTVIVQSLQIDDLITVFGLEEESTEENRFSYSGKVNINTAPMAVVAALLPEGMEEFAQDAVDFRLEKGEDSEDYTNSLDKGWYKQVIDLSGEEQKRFERLISYSSSVFKVESTAVENKTTVKMVAYLKREQNKENGSWDCRIIRMERDE